MVEFVVSVEGDKAVIARLRQLPPALHAALKAKIQLLTLMLERKVKEDYLSGPTAAHSLSIRSGNLKASVFQRVDDSATAVTGFVGFSGVVPYAAIHEFGGVIHVPEIVPVKAQALHFFTKAGEEVFTKRVGPHDVHMPERAPLRTAFREMQSVIVSELKQAVTEAMASP